MENYAIMEDELTAAEAASFTISCAKRKAQKEAVNKKRIAAKKEKKRKQNILKFADIFATPFEEGNRNGKAYIKPKSIPGKKYARKQTSSKCRNIKVDPKTDFEDFDGKSGARGYYRKAFNYERVIS